MIARTSKLILQFIAAVVVGIGLIAAVAAWQLGRGPVSLDFLTPYIEDEMTPVIAPVRVELGRTVLLWAGFDRALDVRVLDLRLVGAGDRIFASVPEASVRFSLRALLAGVIAPTSIELLGPRLKLVRRDDGSVDLGIDQGVADEAGEAETAAAVGRLLHAFFAPPSPDRSTGWLTRIAVDSGFLTVDDRRKGVVWTASRVTLAIDRDVDGLFGEGTLVVEQGELRGRFEVSGRWTHDRGLQLGVSFADLPPAMLAAIEPEAAPLDRIELPLTGTLTATLDRDLRPEGITFDLSSGTGSLALPELYAKRLAVTSLNLRGRIEAAAGRLVIDDATVDLGGPSASLRGSIDRREGRLVFDVDAEARAVPLDDLSRLWPEGLAAEPRAWVTQNIRRGIVDVARFHLAGEAPSDDPQALLIHALSGEMSGAGITVHYLRPMEPVRDVRARAVFDRDWLGITADAGQVRDLRLESARIDIRGLAAPADVVETIDISVAASGGVRQALEMVDQKPLGYATSMGIAPASADGRQRTEISVSFPLLKRLRFVDVAVRATSRIEGLTIGGGPLGQPISAGDIELTVDPRQLIAGGRLQLGPVPMTVKLVERFGPKDGPGSRYEAQFTLTPEQRHALGVETAPWLDGDVGITLDHQTTADGRARGRAVMDLAGAVLALEPLDWSKPAGLAGHASVTWDMVGDRLQGLRDITIDAGGLGAAGSIDFVAGSDAAWPEILRATVTRLALPGTDISGRVEFDRAAVPEVSLTGRSLDLRRLIKRIDDDDDGDSVPVVVRVAPDAPLERVRLGEETVITNVSGVIEIGRETASAAHVAAILPGGGDFDLVLSPAGTDRRALSIASSDAGAVLHALDWSDNVKGGRLKVVGHFDDSVPDRPLDAVATVEDFVLLNGPALARLITLVSPIGIVDALSGPGIGFSRLEVPVNVTPAKITLRNARARGADLGISAAGTIARGTGALDLSGEIAPVRILNALLANIPIIGTLLTGGGEGIFAWTWSAKGTVDEPDFSVNPLSVLTPGIARRIIRELGNVSSVDQEPK